MVTAISDMENPLDENDTILTNSEEDEDIPFTVDEVLIRSGAPNGMELFRKEKNYFGEVPDTRRRSKTDSFKGYKKIFIDSVEALEEGEQYMTQNGNKLFKVSEEELILVSITTGKTVHIPIIIKVKNMSIVPVILDRHAVDPTVNTTAEAVIEDLTGVTLYSGISLFEEKSERGKVIFSLKELPVGVTFKHIDTNVTIERSPSNEFFINGQVFLPAKEEQLLSGSSLLKSPSQESSPTSSRKNSANKMPMMTSEMPNPSIHILESSINSEDDNNDDDDDDEEDEFSAYLHHVDNAASSAFKKFFLLSEVPSYEDACENPRVEEKSQLEKSKRLTNFMKRVEQYYSTMEGSSNVVPFTSQYEDKFYSSSFVKALQTFVHDKETLLSSKSQLQFSKYLEKYQDL